MNAFSIFYSSSIYLQVLRMNPFSSPIANNGLKNIVVNKGRKM